MRALVKKNVVVNFGRQRVESLDVPDDLEARGIADRFAGETEARLPANLK